MMTMNSRTKSAAATWVKNPAITAIPPKNSTMAATGPQKAPGQNPIAAKQKTKRKTSESKKVWPTTEETRSKRGPAVAVDG
jgi:hypothetical protein